MELTDDGWGLAWVDRLRVYTRVSAQYINRVMFPGVTHAGTVTLVDSLPILDCSQQKVSSPYRKFFNCSTFFVFVRWINSPIFGKPETSAIRWGEKTKLSPSTSTCPWFQELHTCLGSPSLNPENFRKGFSIGALSPSTANTDGSFCTNSPPIFTICKGEFWGNSNLTTSSFVMHYHRLYRLQSASRTSTCIWHGWDFILRSAQPCRMMKTMRWSSVPWLWLIK